MTDGSLLRPGERRVIARILKINHAGEHGAIRIYRAQIAVARRLYPDLVAPLSQLLGHELEHHAAFEAAMRLRGARACRLMGLSAIGGSVLGLGSALLGRQSIWATTAAVEATVHRHLNDQLAYLRERDAALHGIIARIRDEEVSHLDLAEASIVADSWMLRTERRLISLVTELLIWLSTSGDSARLHRDMASPPAHNN